MPRGPANALGTCCRRRCTRSRMCAGSRTPAAKAAGTDRQFKAMAEKLGIEVTKDPRIGWSPHHPRPGHQRGLREHHRRVWSGAPAAPVRRTHRRGSDQPTNPRACGPRPHNDPVVSFRRLPRLCTQVRLSKMWVRTYQSAYGLSVLPPRPTRRLTRSSPSGSSLNYPRRWMVL